VLKLLISLGIGEGLALTMGNELPTVPKPCRMQSLSIKYFKVRVIGSWLKPK